MAGLRGKALVAYLVVCVFWGSTYLAIRVGVGVLPPFLFAGLRFLIAGLLLLTVVLALGDTLPKRLVDWRTQAIVGVLLLAGGNAFVVWAEQYTASGVASIFVVTVALWMAFFDAIIPGGSGDLNWRVVTGLLLGFLGTALLVGASPAEILRADLRGPIALTCASASWSLGSVYSKRHRTETSPYVGAAIQMIAGGAAIALVGTLLGEWHRWHLTPRGAGALAYLVVVGSILGYSAYTYALRHASPTIVGTYAYVNPVIAVLLGWLILHEPVTARTFLAMALILGAVVWIQFSHKIGRTAGQSDGRRRRRGRSVRRPPSMRSVNLAEKFRQFNEHWSPKIVGEVNDSYVKLVKVKGEFVWHHHELEDELFLVVKGRLLLKFRDRDVWVGEGEFVIVPRGVEHLPVASEEAHVLLLEPKTTLNTGNVRNERTISELDRI